MIAIDGFSIYCDWKRIENGDIDLVKLQEEQKTLKDETLAKSYFMQII
jgi:hypothetical protein